MSEQRKRRVFAVDTPEGTKYVCSLPSKVRVEYFRRMAEISKQTQAGAAPPDSAYQPDEILVAFALCTQDGLPFGTFDESFAEVTEWETAPDGAIKLCALKVSEVSGLGVKAADDSEKK